MISRTIFRVLEETVGQTIVFQSSVAAKPHTKHMPPRTMFQVLEETVGQTIVFQSSVAAKPRAKHSPTGIPLLWKPTE